MTGRTYELGQVSPRHLAVRPVQEVEGDGRTYSVGASLASRPRSTKAATKAATKAILALAATVAAVVVHAGLARNLLLVLAAAATAATVRPLNQAAAATLPRQWQPVSVTVLVLAVATSITSAQPPMLQTLGNLLPTAAGTSAIRAAIDGSGSALLRAALVLAAWFAIGLIVAMLQTERARTASVGELKSSARLR